MWGVCARTHTCLVHGVQASTALGKHVARSSASASARGADAMYAASPASGSGAAGGTSSVDGADFYAVAALWFPDKWRCHKSVFLVAMLAQALRAARVAVDAQSRWWEADEAAQAQALEVSSPPCCAALCCRARQLSFVFMLAPAPSCCAALWCCASCCVGVCVGSTVHSLCQVHTCKPAPVMCP